MLKSKKSKFIVFTILSIVVLLCFIPLIDNMDYFFGMRRFKSQHIDGDVDLSVDITLELHSDIFSTRYIHYIEFDLTFNESVTDVEVEGIHYRVYHNGAKIYTYISNSYFTAVSVSLGGPDVLYGDNLTFQGSVELNYQLNSNPQNDTMNFNLIFTYDIREQDLNNYKIGKSVIILAYIASFFLLPIILYFTIHPDFYEPSKEEREKSEEYFNYLTKKKQENSN